MSGPVREQVAAAPTRTVQRACSVCGPHPAASCPACGGSLLPERGSRLPLQAKLRVNPADDVFEREADRVADTVLAASPRAAPVGAATPAVQAAPAVEISNFVQRLVDEDEVIDATDGDDDDGDEALQMAAGPGAAREATPAQEARVSALRAGGTPLSESNRAFFEPRFGHDFGAVRIHDDAGAAHSARELGARAYTVGNDVVFGAGEFQPGSPRGRHLLAHELTHVVQQSGGSGAGVRTAVQREVLQRDGTDDARCGTPPASPEQGAVKRVRVMQGDGLVTVELNDGKSFSTQLDRAGTRIDKGTYTAIHEKNDANDCIVGAPDSQWHVNKVPLAGGWAAIPSSSYELVVSETSPAFEPDPADIGKKAKAGKDAGAGDGRGVGKDGGAGAGSGKGAGDQGKGGNDKGDKDKDKEHGGTQPGQGNGGKQPGDPDADRKLLTDFQKQLGEAGGDTTIPPDTEIAAALKELTEAERADLARYLRDAKSKADEEGKAFDAKDVIKYYKDLSPSDRELLRTNLALSKSKTGATELPEHLQIAIETGTEKTAVAGQQVDELNGQLARIHAKVTNPTYKKALEPINLDELPVFTEMMMLEGLLAGASSKSAEIEGISKELMGSIHGIRDYVFEEMAWLAAELAATSVVAALLAPVTAGLSELAAAGEAAYVIKRLNDLRKFLQKVEKIYNTIQKIRSLINRVIGVYETYKRVKAQYDIWSIRLEKLQDMLDKAGEGDDVEDQIDQLEDQMLEELQKSLDDPQGMGGLLEQFYIPADTSVEELKEILFDIPKGIEAFRDMISFYGGVDRRSMEDVKTLAYKGVRAGALLYPFVGYLAMMVGNELQTLMQQPDLSDRLLGIVTNAYDKASKRKKPTASDNRAQLRKVKPNKDKKKDAKAGDRKSDKKAGKKGDEKDKGKDPGKGAKKTGGKGDKGEENDDPKAPKKKQDDKDKKDADAKKKDDDKKQEDEDPKKKKEREEKAQADGEWQQVVDKVAALKTAYTARGVVKSDLLADARKINKAHKTVAGAPKLTEPPGRGFWQVTIARKGSPGVKAVTDVLMHERTRFSKGRRAVEAKVAGLPADKVDAAGIGAEIRPLQDAFAFKILRVGDRRDGRQGMAVFGAMGTNSEAVLATIDSIKDMHFGTKADPIPVDWYKHPGNYPKEITLHSEGKAKRYAMNSPELLTRKKRAGDVDVFIGIDMNNLVDKGTLMQRRSTPRSGTKQDDYRKVLMAAGYDMKGLGKDADHVRDLAFGGADDFDNLWPLDSKINRWAYTGEWYMKYTVEYRDQKNLRQANEGTLFGLRGLWFKVVGTRTTPAKMGGKTSEWKSPDKP